MAPGRLVMEMRRRQAMEKNFDRQLLQPSASPLPQARPLESPPAWIHLLEDKVRSQTAPSWEYDQRGGRGMEYERKLKERFESLQRSSHGAPTPFFQSPTHEDSQHFIPFGQQTSPAVNHRIQDQSLAPALSFEGGDGVSPNQEAVGEEEGEGEEHRTTRARADPSLKIRRRSSAVQVRTHLIATTKEIPPWQHLKPPANPMYLRPVTKPRYRTDVWKILPTFRGNVSIMSNKGTQAEEGQYAPSLDIPGGSYSWRLARSHAEGRSKTPWISGEHHKFHGRPKEPDFRQQEREFALSCYTLSNSRPAGVSSGHVNQPRRKQTEMLSRTIHSQGVQLDPEASCDSVASVESGFPAAALLPGSLKESVNDYRQSLRLAEMKEREPELYVESRRVSLERLRTCKHDLALTLRPHGGTEGIKTSSSYRLLGTHVLCDEELRSRSSSLGSRTTLPSQDSFSSSPSTRPPSLLGAQLELLVAADGAGNVEESLPSDLSELKRLRLEAESVAYGWRC
ncbi:hypothetical protein GUITHDRAFT_104579 [Guillardia theta CCMP2712]|uniref:Uncharacterized protein n=1 Tax=Guillardia theta (strain CCMP2712) TaxID=905079 RepID=L1JNG0_GUITC|nr:hypothetical protein GUITHDRAFT_104579 [Guillardia theta CCMP2712]EKX49618.1 hypothetical protein GUITHDRAFT_104579 [Guillardia theta CCMP2712]|eukprot:XP_005836598.1 hypothetical protein GUITHDRAFT_104579 [Guillardia theta CCMP2712]